MDSGREHCSIVLVLTTRSWGGKILLNFVVIQSQITLQQLKKKKKLQNFFVIKTQKKHHKQKKKKKKKKNSPNNSASGCITA
jgi:hypothetical protein